MTEIPSPLSRSQAFSAGVQLWLFTDFQHSSWTALIDWQINFQITKNRLKKTKQSGKDHKKALLIAGRLALPCQQLVELPYTEHWLNEARQIHSFLNSPSVRVFIPFPIPLESAQKTFSEGLTQFVLEKPKENLS